LPNGRFASPDNLVYTKQLGWQHQIAPVSLWCYQMTVKKIIHSSLLSFFAVATQPAFADFSDAPPPESFINTYETPDKALFSHTWLRQEDKRDWDITLFNRHPREDQAWLWYQTKVTFGLALGVLGAIALLPERISKWDKSNIQPLHKWWRNVKSGPVRDTDEWYINYIGHPYFGGVYYVAARSSGYNPWNSFIYSFLMSTFVYEYGVEAMCEVPSIQDIIVTPVGGWLYGELAYRGKMGILANGSKVLGSQLLGSVTLWLLDPVGKFSQWLSGNERNPVQNLSLRLSIVPPAGSVLKNVNSRYLGMELFFDL